MRVRILSVAEYDLEDGYRFYESQADDLGTYFLDTLYSDIDSLAYFAGIHRVVFGYLGCSPSDFPLPCITESLTTRFWYSPFWIAAATRVGQERNYPSWCR